MKCATGSRWNWFGDGYTFFQRQASARSGKCSFQVNPPGTQHWLAAESPSWNFHVNSGGCRWHTSSVILSIHFRQLNCYENPSLRK